MKHFIFILFICLSTLANAQKFAYVDSEYILERIPEYETAQKELDKLAEITWWDTAWYQAYPQKYRDKIARLQANQKEKEDRNNFFPILPSGDTPPSLLLFVFGIGLLSISMLTFYRIQKIN